MDANIKNKATEGNTGKKLANFSGGNEDFMSMSTASKDKVQAITSKDIRKYNDEFLISKGIKPADLPGNQNNVTDKPKRAPGAPSPEPAKKKKKKNKNKGEQKGGMPKY